MYFRREGRILERGAQGGGRLCILLDSGLAFKAYQNYEDR